VDLDPDPEDQKNVDPVDPDSGSRSATLVTRYIKIYYYYYYNWILPFRETPTLICPCPPVRDSGAPVRDSGAPVRDFGAPVRDSGAPVRDSWAPVRAASVMESYPPVSGGKQTENIYSLV